MVEEMVLEERAIKSNGHIKVEMVGDECYVCVYSQEKYDKAMRIAQEIEKLGEYKVFLCKYFREDKQ